MMAFMLWSLTITALFGGAAHMLESMLRARSRPGRWSWAMAMAGAVALPAWALTVGPSQAPPAPGGPRPGVPVELTTWWHGMGERMPPLLERLDGYAGALWILTSVVLLTGLVGGFWRLGRRARSWPRRRVAGHDVLISESFGPALVGVLSPDIVLPRWLLEQGEEAIALVCAHEAEHREARDTWLLAGAAVTVALLPWNAALWWQLMRLRAALELDCDLRVVDDGVAPSRYAGLLLRLGTESDQLSVAIPAFVQPPTLLERRLTMLINGVRRRGPIATLASLVGAALLTVVACEAPAPTLAPDSPTRVALDRPEQPSPTLKLEKPGEGVSPPLVFVDGERVDAREPRLAIADLDPTGVESITVLKGPNAVELYGADAEGGVILIELKNRSSPTTDAARSRNR